MTPCGHEDECTLRTLAVYPEMKDSRVPAFGAIPAHWQVPRIKDLCCMRSGEGITAESIQPVGPYPVYGGNGQRGYTSEYTHDGTFVLIGRQGALCGNVHLAQGRFWASEHAVVTTIRSNYLPEWLGAVLSVMDLNQYSIAAAQPGLSVERVLNLRLPVPPASEQAAIIRFLNHVDPRIQHYIRAKRKLIALLEEQKQAVINQAVTGQIDVRTRRPYAAYKNSGVEWRLTVPDHWKIRRLGQIARVFNGATPSRARSAYWEEGTVPWLNSSTVNEEIVTEPSELVTEQAIRDCSIAVVPPGAIILGLVGQGRTRGLSALLGIEATISQNLAAVVPGPAIDGRFLHSLLTAFYENIREMGRGGNQEALNCDLVSRLRLPVPPLSEQVAIAGHVASISRKLVESIEKVAEEVGLVEEFRSRLIADVVTGKLDVREAAAGLPQLDPLAAEEDPDDDFNLHLGSEASVETEEGGAEADVVDVKQSEVAARS